MKIKSSSKPNRFLQRFWLFIRQRRVVIVTCFLTYNLCIAGVGFTLFFNNISIHTRNKLIKKVSAVKTTLASWKNGQQSTVSGPAFLAIDLHPDDWRAFAGIKARAVQGDAVPKNEKSSAPATVSYHGRTYPVELSLKCRGPVYDVDQNGWHYTVRLQGEETIEGRHLFTIRPVAGSYHIKEWLALRLFEYGGLEHLPYEIVEVGINGAPAGLYILEAVLERPVVRFWDLYWKQDVQNTALSTLTDTTEKRFAERARELLEGFRNNTRRVEQVFDVQKSAYYFAAIELLGGGYPSGTDHLPFLYNPKTDRLQPIVRGVNHLRLRQNQPLLGSWQQIVNMDASFVGRGPAAGAWYDYIFEDSLFFEAYTQALESICSPGFLNRFYEEIEEDLIARQDYLLRRFPDSNEEIKTVLDQNQAFIRKYLSPVTLVQPYFERYEDSTREILLHLANIYHLPVQVIKATLGDTVELTAPLPGIIPAARRLQPAAVQKMRFTVPGNRIWADSMIGDLRLYCRIPGSQNILVQTVIPYSVIDEELLTDDLMRAKPNARDFDFLTFDESRKQIRIKAGTHRLNTDLIIPGGYVLTAGEGVELDMTGRANIICYAPVQLIGSEQHPIRIYSSDSTAQGIVIMKAGKTSHLQHVHFDNLSNPATKGWSLTAAVTFYRSPADIRYCRFSNNRLGDDYLNIVQSGYIIDNTVFDHSYADAFDGDFADGTISRSTFIHSGNDAIDISGSNLTVDNILIDKTGDKGLSAGEKSTISGRNVRVKNAEIAVTSKDWSSIKLNGIDILDSRIAYTAFQKKAEFGPAQIAIEGRALIRGRIEIPYLIEDNCTMTIDGSPVQVSLEVAHVKQMLYGVKYGKSSR